MPTLLVLSRPKPGARPPPSETPLGRALQRLAAEGIRGLVGTAAEAWGVEGDRWIPADPQDAEAIHDRFPSWSYAEEHREAMRGLEDLPRANGEALQALCRDKLRCQAFLTDAGLLMPDVEADPTRFAERLEGWGVGFLKPRYGALGRGVQRVVPGDPLPARGEGAVRGVDEPMLLQAAVPPPPGLAGLALRALIQRAPLGGLLHSPLVARCSAVDPVVNASRGASLLPAEELVSIDTVREARRLAESAFFTLAAADPDELLIELGVDLVVASDGEPWLIELNGRPGGRLSGLAAADPARFQDAATEALARPLRALAAMI
jgi:glutathione synthase/RimK-type ligase-like ATP-grasp enzyme